MEEAHVKSGFFLRGWQEGQRTHSPYGQEGCGVHTGAQESAGGNPNPAASSPPHPQRHGEISPCLERRRSKLNALFITRSLGRGEDAQRLLPCSSSILWPHQNSSCLILCCLSERERKAWLTKAKACPGPARLCFLSAEGQQACCQHGSLKPCRLTSKDIYIIITRIFHLNSLNKIRGDIN